MLTCMRKMHRSLNVSIAILFVIGGLAILLLAWVR